MRRAGFIEIESREELEKKFEKAKEEAKTMEEKDQVDFMFSSLFHHFDLGGKLFFNPKTGDWRLPL